MNEFRSIFNYANIHENLSDYHIKLMTQMHDYFSESRHELFMQTDIKHDYFSVSIHSDDQHILVFIISDIKQLQSTQMLQKTSSVSFIFVELMSIALKSIPASSSEFLLLHTGIENSDDLSQCMMYIDDIFEEFQFFEDQYNFLRNHFLSCMK